MRAKGDEMRLDGYTKRAVAPLVNHWTRHSGDPDQERHRYRNINIDPARTELNYSLMCARGDTFEGVWRAVSERIDTVEAEVKPNANHVSSFVVTLPRWWPKDRDSREFFEATAKALAREAGEKNVVGAFVHMDETTPHMHFVFTPITLRAKETNDKTQPLKWTKADERKDPTHKAGTVKRDAKGTVKYRRVPVLGEDGEPVLELALAQSAMFPKRRMKTLHDDVAETLSQELGMKVSLRLTDDEWLDKLMSVVPHEKLDAARKAAEKEIEKQTAAARAAKDEAIADQAEAEIRARQAEIRAAQAGEAEEEAKKDAAKAKAGEEKARAELAQAQAELAATNRDKATAEANAKAARQAEAAAKRREEEAKARAEKAEEKADEAEERAGAADAKATAAETRAEMASDEAIRSETRKVEALAEQRAAEEAVEKAREAREQAESALIEKRAEEKAVTERLERLRGQEDELAVEVGELQAELESLDAGPVEGSLYLAQHKDDGARERELAVEIAILREQVASIERSERDAAARVAALRDARDAAERRVRELAATVAQIRNHVASLVQQVAQALSGLRLKWAKRSDGYERHVRAVEHERAMRKTMEVEQHGDMHGMVRDR